MSDMQISKRLETARFSSSSEGTLANTAGPLVAALHTREQRYSLTDANAATNLAEQPMAAVTLAANGSGGAKFVSGNITLPANLVANTTNYVTVNVWKRAAANYAAQILAFTANITSNVTQWTPLAFTVANAANALVVAGDVLTVSVTKGGSGAYLANGAAALIDWAYEDI